MDPVRDRTRSAIERIDQTKVRDPARLIQTRR
jgi:hypothetical protein